MEYLWNMTNPNVIGDDPTANTDPLANSLFNITTLKALVAIGQQTVDIVGYNKTLVYGTDFNLDNWLDIAETLELTDTNDKEIGKKRAYMIWLWMKTAWDLTFEQSQNGGSF